MDAKFARTLGFEGHACTLAAVEDKGWIVTVYAYKGELRYEHSTLLLKRTQIKVGRLPAGKVTIEFEMRTPLERAAPAEVAFFINCKQAATGSIERNILAGFTASETFDLGMDSASPVADDCFEQAPFPFTGTIERLHFSKLGD